VTLLPSGATVLQADDTLLVLSSNESFEAVLARSLASGQKTKD